MMRKKRRKDGNKTQKSKIYDINCYVALLRLNICMCMRVNIFEAITKLPLRLLIALTCSRLH